MLNAVLRPMGWWMHKNIEGRDHRFWFHKEEAGRNRLSCINFSMHWFQSMWGLMFEVELSHDNEHSVQIRLGLPFLLTIFLSFELGYRDWIEKIAGKYGSVAYGFRICPEHMRFEWRFNDNDWNNDRLGWRWSYYWYQLRGKEKCLTEKLWTNEVQFHMPAGKGYPPSCHSMTLTREKMTWTWSRLRIPGLWAYRKSRVGWDIRLETPPAFPGKWSKDDGIFACGAPGHLTASEAVQHYIQMVQKERERRG